jgi:hypothetical protein
VSWVASIAGTGGRRRYKRQRSGGRDALSAVGIAVSRVAGIASAGRSRRDKRQSTSSRDALSAVRVAMSRVASKASSRGCGGRRCRCHERQSTSGRNALSAIGVAVSRVASILSAGSCVSSQRSSESACGGDGQREEDAVVHDDFEGVLSRWLLGDLWVDVVKKLLLR